MNASKSLPLRLLALATITMIGTMTGNVMAAVVTVTGSSGSFGSLGTSTPTDVNTTESVSLGTSSPPSWGFGAGEAAWFTTLTAGHTLIIANETQTDNPLQPTADHMAVSTWNASASTPFHNIVIPTSTGATTALEQNGTATYAVGGADIEDVQDIPAALGRPERVAFTSAVPYWGWDPTVVGEYPTIGFLKNSASGWVYDAATSKTAEQIAASTSNTTLADATCPLTFVVRNCQGFTEIALLPKSKDLVVTQYFPPTGATSGAIIVLSPTGALLARYAYPTAYAPGQSTPLSVSPREVKSDPTSSKNQERFVVIFDTWTASGAQAAFAAQEFVFNASTSTVAPSTAAFRSDQTGTAGFETSTYDSAGNLWMAQRLAGVLTAAPLTRYTRSELSACTPAANWPQNYGMTCAPHDSIPQSAALGSSISVDEDPKTHNIFNTTLSGYLQVVQPSGATFAQRLVINLGFNSLVNRFTYLMGPRKSTVDSTKRQYFIPVQMLQNDAVTGTQCGYGHTPHTLPCAPPLLNQWLYTVDLKQLLGT